MSSIVDQIVQYDNTPKITIGHHAYCGKKRLENCVRSLRHNFSL